MWYSVGIFCFTVFVGACLLVSGKFANKKKRLYTFITDKIAEEKGKEKDKKAKAEALAAQAARQAEEEEQVTYAINDDARN